jgi:HEAT repeat protein
LSGAGSAAVGLTGHHLARVRAQAVRTLAAVGDTEHVAAVAALADDPEPTVRAATERAMTRLIERLDLPS